MVQYLQVALKRDFAAGWWHAIERVSLFLEKASQERPKDKTEQLDWRDKLAKNVYY